MQWTRISKHLPGKNREKLDNAADEYREGWIHAQVAKMGHAEAKTKSRASSTAYERQLEVERIVSGISVKLALQERTSATVENPWWTLSWRTKYSPVGPNRRFYLTKQGCWYIPAKVALEMIDELEAMGGMSQEYVDQRQQSLREPLVSTKISDTEKAVAFEGITVPKEDWGANPFFVISFDPNDQWKKVMIINTDTNVATFRSITADIDYMPRKLLRPDSDWWLDNSMMDANVQQMCKFHMHLKNHLAGI